MRRGRLVKTPSELTSTPSPCEISPKIMGKTVKGVRKETPNQDNTWNKKVIAFFI